MLWPTILRKTSSFDNIVTYSVELVEMEVHMSATQPGQVSNVYIAVARLYMYVCWKHCYMENQRSAVMLLQVIRRISLVVSLKVQSVIKQLHLFIYKIM